MQAAGAALLLMLGLLPFTMAQAVEVPAVGAARWQSTGIAPPTQPGATASPQTGGGIAAPALTLTPTPIPTNTPRAGALIPAPTATPAATAAWGEDHFWFIRPFAYDPSGRVIDYPARGYAYGSTSNGSLQVHHGIDIENPLGTWVQAVGDGTVFYAGQDDRTQFGPALNFYGNLVVIQHDRQTPDAEPIFTLYGHLSEIAVSSGDSLAAGDVIGAVGATGVAFGSHLHIEVRIGDPYDYNATYNPELWLSPWPNFGVFAARIYRDDQRMEGLRVELQGEGRYFIGWTYANDNLNGDPYLGENVAIGDMPTGYYDLKVTQGRFTVYRDTVFIKPDTVTFMDITIP